MRSVCIALMIAVFISFVFTTSWLCYSSEEDPDADDLAFLNPVSHRVLTQQGELAGYVHSMLYGDCASHVIFSSQYIRLGSVSQHGEARRDTPSGESLGKLELMDALPALLNVQGPLKLEPSDPLRTREDFKNASNRRSFPPPYAFKKPCEGTIVSMGDDTLNNIITLCAESFLSLHPNVHFNVEGNGGTSAPSALAFGQSQIGPMVEKMSERNLEQFRGRNGFDPTPFVVAVEMTAVYVNKDNPLESLSMAQVDAIFSTTRKRNWPDDIVSWDQLGLQDDWKDREIVLYGRNMASGGYGYFKRVALNKGEYKSSMIEQPGSSGVTQAVAGDIAGIGYAGIGYRIDGVKALKLVASENGIPVAPNYASMMNGTYPLSRFLYVYVAIHPEKPLDPCVREFMKFMLSLEGQHCVLSSGFIPIPAEMAMEQLKMLRDD